eukprot:GAHX01000023.1.p1 GENE.GAHX01000023.1~~GAHX01000023.1.p1  ORF type:complete len:111 (-),score=14.65 GAHX01000023.1:34-366(-)
MAPITGTGRGKTGKGLGKTGAKRLKRIGGATKPAMSKPGLRRLCRRAGSTRVSNQVYDKLTTLIHNWVKNIVKKCCIYTEHSGRKTVVCIDVIYALRRCGLMLYGYGSNK